MLGSASDLYPCGLVQVSRCIEAYLEALRENGLKPVLGENASQQPGNIQEILLHETAVAWLRRRLAASVPEKAWLESREEYAARLRKCCEEVNGECDVEGLCRAFMGRITKLLNRKSGRLAE